MLLGSNRCGALVALAMAAALCGCANIDSSSWFSKPLDLFGTRSGYTYSSLGDARQDRSITANDLVDANGACPRLAAPAPTPAQSAPGNPVPDAAVSAETAALLGGGVAIGMSECDVVARLGQATAVNLGRTPSGDRAVVLTYNSGPRPGVYRFAGGRLTEMDRVELPPPPPPEPAKKKTAKKKPEKPTAPPPDNKT